MAKKPNHADKKIQDVILNVYMHQIFCSYIFSAFPYGLTVRFRFCHFNLLQPTHI